MLATVWSDVEVQLIASGARELNSPVDPPSAFARNLFARVEETTRRMRRSYRQLREGYVQEIQEFSG